MLRQRERNLCGLHGREKEKKNIKGGGGGYREKERKREKEKEKREKEYRTEGRSGRVEAVSIVECNHSFLFLRFNF